METEYKQLNVRVSSGLMKGLKRLAKDNRRTLQGEVEIMMMKYLLHNKNENAPPDNGQGA
jgi:hypothetical protein